MLKFIIIYINLITLDPKKILDLNITVKFEAQKHKKKSFYTCRVIFTFESPSFEHILKMCCRDERTKKVVW